MKAGYFVALEVLFQLKSNYSGTFGALKNGK